MEITNQTPFPAIAWDSVDSNERWYQTSLIRVKYQLVYQNQQWQLRLASDQGELFGADVFYDEDIYQPVQYESDFVTFKQHSDIIVNANTYSPTQRAEKNWTCSVSVSSPDNERLNHSELRIKGAHEWQYTSPVGWSKTVLKKTQKVSLRYSNAFGGKVANPDAEGDTDLFLAYSDYNAVGTGITHKDMPKENFPAHQLEFSHARLKQQKYAAGFGFTHRSWKPRIDYAGTYDQDWLDNTHPNPPQDFDVKHHQAANPELLMQGYIQANSMIRLNNLHPEQAVIQFHLPELHCFTDIHHKQQFTRQSMVIDTVLIDIESEDETAWCVYLSYRHYAPLLTQITSINFSYLPTALLATQGNNPPSKKGGI